MTDDALRASAREKNLSAEDETPEEDKTPEQRREEVFSEALRLVSERGIAGASLRELAKRLELSQPSLYHYFKSKDELIDELVERGAAHMVQTMNLPSLPEVPLAQIPHAIAENILTLWTGEQHARYVRFLFIVAIESPRHVPIIRRVFEQRLFGEPPAELQFLFRHDPELAERLVSGLLMLARALGLALIEERILFGAEEPSERTRAHAQFIAEVVSRVITEG